MRRKPIYVDLDVGQNQISIPGCISASSIFEPIDVEEPFFNLSPIVYFYGHETPSKNIDLYKRQVETLASVLKGKVNKDPEAKLGGLYVNTCGWVDQGGYGLLLHAIKTFGIDHVLVVGDPRLGARLSKELHDKKKFDESPSDYFVEASSIKVERLQKSGGVVNRSQTFRKSSRSHKIHEYFYGPLSTLSPHTILVKFDDVEIVQIGAQALTPQYLLPIGEKSSVDPCAVVYLI